MIAEQCGECRDPRVRAALAAVPRHRFVPAAVDAYADSAQAIGRGQTISQPRVVAFMLAQLAPRPGERVLDVGAGSGYTAALLAWLVGPTGRVDAVERQGALCAAARPRLDHWQGEDGVAPITLRCADAAAADECYDCIHVACAAPRIPPSLLAALAPGGRMLIPVGTDAQHLVRVARDVEGRIDERRLWPVRFVPMLDGSA